MEFIWQQGVNCICCMLRISQITCGVIGLVVQKHRRELLIIIIRQKKPKWCTHNTCNRNCVSSGVSSWKRKDCVIPFICKQVCFKVVCLERFEVAYLMMLLRLDTMVSVAVLMQRPALYDWHHVDVWMFISLLPDWLKTCFSYIGDSRRSVTLPGQRKHVAFVPGTRVSSLYADVQTEGGGTTGSYVSCAHLAMISS